jgi:predicted AlkP superfamily pyrophosphatase or phosphodiesterase
MEEQPIRAATCTERGAIMEDKKTLSWLGAVIGKILTMKFLYGATCCAVLLLGSFAHGQGKPHVLMISIDGMRPDYVTAARAHHADLPSLQRIMATGTYADRVINSLPTNTYPNHTTLVTGVSPAQHGIYNNMTFDPLLQHPNEWYWFASEVRVPTLWQAASRAGLTTASVGWPVTNGAKGIDYLITEFAQSEDGAEITSLKRDNPPNLRSLLDPDDKLRDADGDVRKVAWSTAIIRDHQPNFMTVHLNDLDHIEHETGVFTKEDVCTLEILDGQVRTLMDAELSVDPNAVTVIVSDHGFERVDKRVNLEILFIRAGLAPSRPSQGKLPLDTPWEAEAWDAGGTDAIMLHNPNDQQVLQKVSRLLQEASDNPDYGIARILDRNAITKMGGFPDASFVVEWKPGFSSGRALSGEMVKLSPGKGAHGYAPDRPNLQSSFFMVGHGIVKRRDLGVIDMRQIAPTVARILAIPFSSTQVKAVDYEP